MSEKRKWFDSSSTSCGEDVVLHSAASVSAASCREFLALCEYLFERKRISDKTYRLLTSLGRQQPARRLARNLSIVLQRLADGAVGSVIPAGITSRERKALVEFQRVHVSWEMRAVAQGLLNLHERQQLLQSASIMFREERARPWDMEDE